MKRLMGEWIYVLLNAKASLPCRSWSGVGVAKRNYAQSRLIYCSVSPVKIRIKPQPACRHEFLAGFHTAMDCVGGLESHESRRAAPHQRENVEKSNIKNHSTPRALPYSSLDQQTSSRVQKQRPKINFRIGELNPGLVGTDHLSMIESDKS
jgi:hypothetical protein